MPVELKDKYPFSVDTWSLLSRKKEHHFLTHAHSDHTSGIESFVRRRIYCTDITRLLLLRRFPKLGSAEFIILEIGDTKLILDDVDSFTVTAVDANHCPGAIMLLFEGNFGNMLHTGDCRLTDDCLGKIFGKYKVQQCVLDCVYLDCTFGKEHIRIPSKREAFQQVQQCILNHPKAPIVYLACDLLGQEDLLSDLVMYFRCKIFVDKNLLPDYYADLNLVISDLLTEDPQSTKFHVCEGFPKLYERAKVKFMEAHKLKQEEPLFIRPSAQWYTYGERLEGAGCGMIVGVALKRPTAQRHRTLPAPKAAEKDQYGIWHVCYSAHSSRSELERAMEALWPKEVISTTPHCHAKEVMSGRAGLYHIDMSEAPNVELSWSYRDCSSVLCEPHKDREVLKTSTEVSCTRPLTSSSPCKKVPSDITMEGNCPGYSLEKVVPLFGTARHNIPASPPLSFSSTEYHDSVDSQATELYFSDEDTAEKPPASEKSSSLNVEQVNEAVKKVADVDTVATLACQGCSVDQQVNLGSTQDSSQEQQLEVSQLTAAKPPAYENSSSLNVEQVDEAVKKVADVDAVATLAYQGCSIDQQVNLGSTQDSSQEQHLELSELRKSDGEAVAEVTVTFSGQISSRTKKRTGGVAVLEESTRKLYRSFRVPIPSPLPSLLDLYNFNV